MNEDDSKDTVQKLVNLGIEEINTEETEVNARNHTRKATKKTRKI